MKKLLSLPVFLGLFGALTTGTFALEQPCAQNQPCEIAGDDGGTYHLRFPDDWDGKERLKPFVFFHGHSGSGAGVVRNRAMVKTITNRGYVLIAPDGPMFHFRGRDVRGWAARPQAGSARERRDNIAFTENVLADVEKRVPVDLAETVISGFSSGGSMAWFFSCYSPLPIAATVAVAGGLRRPLPRARVAGEGGSAVRTCPGGPRKVLHIHGYSDNQVPLEGRGIRSWHQGDVFEGLAVQRHTNQCGSRPDKIETKGRFWCRTWNRCGSGEPLRFCLHSGGHGVPKGWIAEVFGWMQKP